MYVRDDVRDMYTTCTRTCIPPDDGVLVRRAITTVYDVYVHVISGPLIV